MKVGYSKQFKKQYKKLSRSVQAKFTDRLDVFLTDETNRLLNIHKLHGRFKGFYSMNVTGDVRAVFEKIHRAKVEFVAIGSHTELYS